MAVGACLGLLLVPLPARADDGDVDRLKHRAHDLDEQIEEQHSDVDASTAEVAAAVRRYEQVRDRVPAARALLSAAQAAVTVAKEQARDATQDLARAQHKLVAAERSLEDVRLRTEAAQTLAAVVVKDLYLRGPLDQLDVVLGSESLSEFSLRLQSVEDVGRATGRLLGDLGALKAEGVQRQEVREAVAGEVTQRQLSARDRLAATRDREADAQEASDALDALVVEQAAALSAAKAFRSQQIQRLAQLKDAQERVKDALAKASRGSGNPSGSLVWPADGSVTQNVGPRVHPVYGYSSCHTGTDIGAGYGAAIRAAAAGTVIDEYSSTAYGEVTLIDHGDGLSTFYAHQSARAVSVGQQVSAGQVIGSAGATGFATGPHLHFEVHVNGTPYDPMGWFGGAKQPVSC